MSILSLHAPPVLRQQPGATGDHAASIAETAPYVITGELLAVERLKGDESTIIEPSLRPPQT